MVGDGGLAKVVVVVKPNGQEEDEVVDGMEEWEAGSISGSRTARTHLMVRNWATSFSVALFSTLNFRVFHLEETDKRREGR